MFHVKHIATKYCKNISKTLICNINTKKNTNNLGLKDIHNMLKSMCITKLFYKYKYHSCTAIYCVSREIFK